MHYNNCVWYFNILCKKRVLKKGIPFGGVHCTIKLFLEKLPASMQRTFVIFAFPAYIVLLVVGGVGRQSVEIRKYIKIIMAAFTGVDEGGGGEGDREGDRGRPPLNDHQKRFQNLVKLVF